MKKPLGLVQTFTLLTLIPAWLQACSLMTTATALEKADSLRKEGEYEQAVALYQEHMRERLASPLREQWENPYFYQLIIGDIYLEMDRPIKAQEHYELAQAFGVEKELIADRFLQLATWMEARKNYSKAVALLESKIALDPLLFHAVIDRMNKIIITIEQEDIELQENE